jgi:hypothetical protein
MIQQFNMAVYVLFRAMLIGSVIAFALFLASAISVWIIRRKKTTAGIHSAPARTKAGPVASTLAR